MRSVVPSSSGVCDAHLDRSVAAADPVCAVHVQVLEARRLHGSRRQNSLLAVSGLRAVYNSGNNRVRSVLPGRVLDAVSRTELAELVFRLQHHVRNFGILGVLLHLSAFETGHGSKRSARGGVPNDACKC